MINIEVESSNDPTALGLYEFEYDVLYIGRSLKNDLIFTDRELPMKFLEIRIVQDNEHQILSVHSLKPEPFFFLNGKKISGKVKARPGDTIAFGKNKLKIVHFKRTQTELDMAEAFERFEKTVPELRFALEFIEEVLLEQEDKSNV